MTTPESDLPPAIGLPIPAREDRTIPLPLVAPIDVDGMTLVEAERAIVGLQWKQDPVGPALG